MSITSWRSRLVRLFRLRTPTEPQCTENRTISPLEKKVLSFIFLLIVIFLSHKSLHNYVAHIDGPRFMYVSKDITEEKAKEAKLRQNRDELERAVRRPKKRKRHKEKGKGRKEKKKRRRAKMEKRRKKTKGRDEMLLKEEKRKRKSKRKKTKRERARKYKPSKCIFISFFGELFFLLRKFKYLPFFVFVRFRSEQSSSRRQCKSSRASSRACHTRYAICSYDDES